MLKRYLIHKRLLVRFLSLLAVVSLIFVGVWGASYWLLPAGLLTGRTGAAVLAGDDLAGGNVWLEWLRILGLNLLVTGLVLVPANLIVTKRGYPFGYVTTIVIAAGFAMTIGTNSFTIPMPERLPPSLSAFGAAGVYEIMAYVLAVTATTSIGRWRVTRWWATQETTERIRPTLDSTTLIERTVGVVLAIVVLAAAGAWEAVQISAALVA